ncbi:MAG: tRNA pseudouridine(13) synthase TruD [Methanosarcinales archaeon]|nr:MAG: tRNA pseudouridine(13) synthase TruD [Methanosarcinales archaeon]
MRITLIDPLIGIDTYLAHTSGIGGTIRRDADDFHVTEVWDQNPRENTSGQYLIVKLTKKNWDTNHLIRDLSRRFRVSRTRFGWAGTKDKRAVTTQRIGIWDPDRTIETEISGVHIPDVQLQIIGRSNKKISLGDLNGNKFRIVIQDINEKCGGRDEVVKRIDNISRELKIAGGMPNFYGTQRFGTIRPITHEVGRLIVSGDFEGAAMAYIAKPFSGERSSEIRRCLWDTWSAGDTCDFKEALNIFPDRLRYELAMLNHIVKYPDDYIGALRTLPKNLVMMFVHAHQSFIFNKILSYRIKENIPLNRAIEGDVVCFRGKNGLPDASKTDVVTPATIDGINNLVRRKRAWVTHSLIGHASKLTSEIEQTVISDLKINIHELTRSFEVTEMPEIASRGGHRAIVIDPDPAFDVVCDEVRGGLCVTSEFFLPKGCYATVLLREYMKSE